MWDQVIYIMGSQSSQYLQSVNMLSKDQQISQIYFSSSSDDQQVHQSTKNYRNNQITVNNTITANNTNININKQQYICIPYLLSIYNSYYILSKYPIYCIITLTLLYFLTVFIVSSSLIIGLILFMSIKIVMKIQKKPKILPKCLQLINKLNKNYLNKSIQTPQQQYKLLSLRKLMHKINIILNKTNTNQPINDIIKQYLYIRNFCKDLKRISSINMGLTFKQKINKLFMQNIVEYYCQEFIYILENYSKQHICQEKQQQNNNQQYNNPISLPQMMLFQIKNILQNTNQNQYKFTTEITPYHHKILSLIKLQLLTKITTQTTVQSSKHLASNQKIENDHQKIQIMQPNPQNSNNAKYRIISQLNGDQQNQDHQYTPNIGSLKDKLQKMINRKIQQISQQEQQIKQEQNIKNTCKDIKRERRVEGFGPLILPKIQIQQNFYLQ